MTSLRPRDVIFLLNKWDYISHEDDDLQEQFFKQSKKHLCNLWEEADESCILKMSAKKVLRYEYNIGFKRNIDTSLISRSII